MKLQIRKLHSAVFHVEADTICELYNKASQHYSVVDVNDLILLYNNDVLQFDKSFKDYDIQPNAVCVALVSDTQQQPNSEEYDSDILPEPFEEEDPLQNNDGIEQLISMGFPRELAETAYEAAGGNVEIALAMMLA